jgi:hypothetical protein
MMTWPRQDGADEVFDDLDLTNDSAADLVEHVFPGDDQLFEKVEVAGVFERTFSYGSPHRCIGWRSQEANARPGRRQTMGTGRGRFETSGACEWLSGGSERAHGSRRPATRPQPIRGCRT